MKNAKIAIHGFFGRMGQSIYKLSQETGYDIIVGIDQREKIIPSDNIKLSHSLSEYSELYDVVIDFSLPNPSINAVKECIELEKPITIGTTGFNDKQIKEINESSKKIPILLAPNMSIGVNTTFQIIEDLSKSLMDYEVSIEETHHMNKVDAPSGTALKIADLIAKTKGTNLDDINIKAFREEGEVGVHKTTFKSENDEIIVYHNAYNRNIFAEGALSTSQWIAEQKPGLYNYRDYMDSIS